MVDYAITPSSVLPTGSTGIQVANASAAVTAGQAIRVSGGTVAPAQADSLANTVGAAGIALASAAIGQPVSYVTGGTVDMGAVFAVGDVVVLSAAAAGGIAPVADLASTNAVVVMGIATTSNLLKLDLNNSGVVKA